MNVEYHSVPVAGNDHHQRYQIERRKGGVRHVLHRGSGPYTTSLPDCVVKTFTEADDIALMWDESWVEQGTVCQAQPGQPSMRHAVAH